MKYLKEKNHKYYVTTVRNRTTTTTTKFQDREKKFDIEIFRKNPLKNSCF